MFICSSLSNIFPWSYIKFKLLTEIPFYSFHPFIEFMFSYKWKLQKTYIPFREFINILEIVVIFLWLFGLKYIDFSLIKHVLYILVLLYVFHIPPPHQDQFTHMDRIRPNFISVFIKNLYAFITIFIFQGHTLKITYSIFQVRK